MTQTENASVTAPALRYHGGKFRLAPWVLSFFPPHTVYVEPFGGGAGVMLQKAPSYAEVYNDLDGEVVNFFRVLRDPEMRAQLETACALTPYARDEFECAWEPSDDPVERARRTAVRALMGFGSAGATKGSTGFRVDCFRKHGTAQHIWQRYPQAITAAGRRFSGVLIERRPALDVILQHDGPETLFYVDPPYLPSTRVVRANGDGTRGAYRCEMDEADHIQLLKALQVVEGMVVLSGYPSQLYERYLVDWCLHTKGARISAGRGTAVRTECLWLNPACRQAIEGNPGGLFA